MKKKVAILALILSSSLIFSFVLYYSLLRTFDEPVHTSDFKSSLSFELYKEKYSKDILNLIENRSTKNGVIEYSNSIWETDVYSTFYALKIYEILGANGMHLKPEVIEKQILDKVALLNKDHDLSTLDILWYLVNMNILINSSSSPQTELNQKIINSVKKYAENDSVYDSLADLYRISALEETFGVSMLDKQKVTAFVNENTTDINETTILSMNFILYIAKANAIDIHSDVEKNIFRFADKTINEMYANEETSLPDLHELFELLCFIKPDYEFNTDAMLKVINKFESPTGLYSIANGQSENLLPTYWGLRIRSKLGQEIGKKEAIISRIMQCQALDGLCNFVSENNIEPTQSYAANAIYKLLEGDKEIHNTFGNISDISPRGRYCYSYFVKDTKSPEQIKNYISQIQDSLKESVQEIRFPKLYMSYFQIVSLKNLNQPIDKSVIEELSKNLEKIDTRGLGRMEKFLFCMLENLIRKEIDAGYSVSKEAKEVISDFMNAENYKDKEFENDTLLCLYIAI